MKFPLEIPKNPTQIQETPNQDEFKDLANKFIREYEGFFRGIMRDAAIRIEVSDRTAVNLKEKRIFIDINDFKMMKERGFSKWQVIWSVCHELSHIHDMYESPKEMLAAFEYVEKRATQMKPQVEAILRRKFPKEEVDALVQKLPVDEKGTTLSQIEMYLQKTFYGCVFNALDDMYVNMTLGNRQTVFHPIHGNQREEVTRLYRDFLFPANPGGDTILTETNDEKVIADYSKRPRHMQLTDVLLRGRMLPDEETIVSEEIREILNRFPDKSSEAFGLTLEKQLQLITSPSTKMALKPGWRYEQYKKTIEPIFWELLLKDLEDLKDLNQDDEQQEQNGGANEGEEQQEQPGEQPGEQPSSKSNSKKPGKGAAGDLTAQKEWTPFGKRDQNPEPLTKEIIQQFIKDKQALEDAETAEQEARDAVNKMTPKERAELADIASKQRMLEKRGLNPEFAQVYKDIEQKIREHKKKLGLVFEELIATIKEQINRHWADGFKTGKFDVNRFIAKYGPEFAAGTWENIPWDELDIYKRQEMESRLSIAPNRIRVRLVVDGSGSMSGPRIEVARELAVLFIESLASAEANINLTFKLEKPFEFDTEIWMYGGVADKVKSFGSEKSSVGDELVDRMLAVSKMNADYGGTFEHIPLIEIAKSMKKDDLEAIEDGKLIDLGFLFTDGGASEAEAAKNALNRVTQTGIVMRGLQISSGNTHETDIFNSIWGENGRSITSIDEVISAVSAMLAEEIQKIQTRVINYELPEE